MMMTEIGAKLKNILADGIRVVNDAATTVVNSTRYKLDELDRVSRRREAIAELGEKAYAMFKAGVEMPEEALPLLTELAALEEGLESLRSEYAQQKLDDKQRKQEEAVARKEQRAAEKEARAALRAAAVQAKNASLEDAVEQMADAEEDAETEEVVVDAPAAEEEESEDEPMLM